MNLYIDLDTGTILNGPVVQVPEELIPDGATDSETIAAAAEYMYADIARSKYLNALDNGINAWEIQ
jgi:hypothetical protein